MRVRGRSVGFGTRYFETQSSVRVIAVDTDKPYYEVGDDLKGTVDLSGGLDDDCSLAIYLKDNYGRVVWRQDVDAPDQSTTFEIPVGKPLTILHTLNADIVRDGFTVSRKIRELSVAMRGRSDDFSFAGWGGTSPTSHLATLQSGEIHRMGLDTRTNCGFGELAAYGNARVNLRAIPYAWIMEFWGSPGVTERYPCLTDPEYRAQERERFHTKTAEMQPYGTQAYTLGDETYFNLFDDGVCYSPSCREKFRDFLREDYGTLDALNEEWGTEYRDWDDLLRVTSPDDLPSNTPAPRADHWRFIDWVVVDAHRFGRQCIREIDPTALVGLDGTESLYASTGIYWYNLVRAVDMINVYPYCDWPQKMFNRHCVRSFLHPGMYSGMWFGGYVDERDEKYERYTPWYSLMLGFNSVWWYDTAIPGEIHNALAPDFAPVDNFRQASEEVREIKAGVGRQIMRSEREHDRIAIHYSQRSFHVDSLLRDPMIEREPGKWQRATTEFITLILDLGLQFQMVATEQIEAGELISDGYKVLIMPCSQALTEQEKVAIFEFVEQGGVVIADYLTGMRDAHLVPLETWDFGELFGLERGAITGTKIEGHQAVATSKPREIVGTTDGIVTLKGEAHGLEADLVLPNRPTPGTTIDPEGRAQALGRSNRVFTAGVVNRYGRGKTLYLNFPVDGYWEDRYLGHETPLREFFRDVLRWAGIEAPVSVSIDGEPASATELVRFRNGNEIYLSICRDPYTRSEEEQKATVQLPESYAVYDMRRMKYLGEENTFEVTLKPGRFELFALLPCPVKSLAIDLAASRVHAGARITGSVTRIADSEPIATHVINIRVFDPDGNEQPHYMQNIEAVNGKAPYELNTAFNDKPGIWRLTARDVVSGQQTTESFEVH